MKTLTTFALAMAALISCATVHAAENHYLADRHIARGMQCNSCHEADGKTLRAAGDLDVCASCHGDYTKMIEKTEGRYTVNPHAQHEGALPCSECHKGHKPGVNYCGQCHNFVYKVP